METLRSGMIGKNNSLEKHSSQFLPFHWFPVIPPFRLLFLLWFMCSCQILSISDVWMHKIFAPNVPRINLRTG